VDAAGAAALRRRLEEQQHWSQAQAVRDGRQPLVDPDRDELEQLGDGFRLYRFRGAGGRLVRKSLAGEFWHAEAIGPADGRGPSRPQGACSAATTDEARRGTTVSDEAAPQSTER
jgi:hypothetical protein